ncbi:MAG: hypothetical protein ACTTKI_11715 [Tannerella sp.]|uniref:hypothetical protein n=1 Tax=Tannerella sp. TaxID=2382127 RepID=UPI003FA1B30C
MPYIKIILCAGSVFLVASCSLFRPKIHLFELYAPYCGISPEDTTKYRDDEILQYIYRYQQNDTLLYDYGCTFERREYIPLIKICGDSWGGKLYTHYAPSSRSGVFGMNIEERHPENIELPGGDVLPLYRFQIDTVIRYRYMTSNERKEEVNNDLYRLARECRVSYRICDFYTEIMTIYYEAAYHYYDKWDASINALYCYCVEDEVLPLTSDLGMCYFPVEKAKIDYYVKKRLMKRFLGFCKIERIPIASQYLQEVDTALLALPTKHFIREFLRTEQLDCLDGKTFPLPKKQPHAPPETAIP